MATPAQYNPGLEAVRVTASPTLQTERARFDPTEGANRLVQALASEDNQRAALKAVDQHEAKKLDDQKLKLDWYVEQFKQDQSSGAVTQAQVKERFPETVPMIASRITEAVGQQHGKEQFQGVLDEIAKTDSLRLDTAARAQFIAKKRSEIVAEFGAGDEFYASGVVASMDRLTAQHEQTWQTETAAYHQKVQADQFSGEVVDAINSGNPAALLALDAKFNASSSLNAVERRKIMVDSVIDLAFLSDDQAVLQAIPKEFLSIDAKAALQTANVQITDRRIIDRKNADALQKAQCDEDERAMKLKIIGDFLDGKPVDPADYRHSDTAFLYALEMREAKKLDESSSVGEAQMIRTRILTQATTGNGPSLETLISQTAGNRAMNPKERQALINDLPKLVEGRNLMAEEMVRQPISDRLGPRLQALESSTNRSIQTLLTGRNLRSEVMRGYDLDIRNSFRAAFEDTGEWPTGHRKLELIDRAVDRAEKWLEQATKISR